MFKRLCLFLLTVLSPVLLILFSLLLPTAAAADTLYVAPAAVGSGDCSSWANACTLTAALSRAHNGSQIWVKAGVHKPGANRADAFNLKSGVAVYGGFAGTETALSQRDPAVNITVLSGDIDNNDVTDAHGVVTDTNKIQGENSYHVVHGDNPGDVAILDGVTITAGMANGTNQNQGGGMHNNYGNVKVSNVVFSGNYAAFGGGMYSFLGTLTLLDVTFSHNHGDQKGGGLYSVDTHPLLANVTFSGNLSGGEGGGMYSEDNPTLTDVTFNDNWAHYGGGVYNLGKPVWMDVTFDGNTASYNGGGIYNKNTAFTMQAVTFIRNRADNGGGGGMFNADSSLTLSNTVFSGNGAENGRGGGIYHVGGSLALRNVTLSNNKADKGGGLHSEDQNPALTNVILWGNTAAISDPQIASINSTPLISYSDVQGSGGSGASWDATLGTDAGGNLDADPLFVDAANHSLRPSSGSPVIDSGANAGCPITDRDGWVFRPVDGNNDGTAVCDMGAYEFYPPDYKIYAVYLPGIIR